MFPLLIYKYLQNIVCFASWPTNLKYLLSDSLCNKFTNPWSIRSWRQKYDREIQALGKVKENPCSSPPAYFFLCVKNSAKIIFIWKIENNLSVTFSRFPAEVEGLTCLLLLYESAISFHKHFLTYNSQTPWVFVCWKLRNHLTFIIILFCSTPGLLCYFKKTNFSFVLLLL